MVQLYVNCVAILFLSSIPRSAHQNLCCNATGHDDRKGCDREGCKEACREGSKEEAAAPIVFVSFRPACSRLPSNFARQSAARRVTSKHKKHDQTNCNNHCVWWARLILAAQLKFWLGELLGQIALPCAAS